LIRYNTGKRREVWKNNVIALGLSAGFVEPLESTSIHLFMIGVTRLIQQFPFGGITPARRAHYNRLADNEAERVRDFVILHYKLTERDDAPFWNRVRTMEIPDTLAERIALFAEQAEAWQAADDLFRVDSWVQVMLGQRLAPCSWHRIGALMSDGRLKKALADMRGRGCGRRGRQRAAGRKEQDEQPQSEAPCEPPHETPSTARDTASPVAGDAQVRATKSSCDGSPAAARFTRVRMSDRKPSSFEASSSSASGW
jgi:hypothetical protein